MVVLKWELEPPWISLHSPQMALVFIGFSVRFDPLSYAVQTTGTANKEVSPERGDFAGDLSCLSFQHHPWTYRLVDPYLIQVDTPRGGVTRSTVK